jgi:quercetin dioxygenase-like cupin family protein
MILRDDRGGFYCITLFKKEAGEPSLCFHWHVHRDGYQVLLVTGGEGWYQEEGEEAQFLKAGHVIVTHDGVKHWHGATKDSWFSHVAITAGTPEWLELMIKRACPDHG